MGVSLGDLGKMGDRALMIKTLDGIAAIDDAGRRATLMMDKFGKSFRTVDAGELADKLRSAAGSGDAYASAIAKAAQLSDKMTEAQGNLSLALLLAFEPIINKVNAFNQAMDESGKTAMGLVNIIKVLGVVLAASFALSAGLKIVTIIGQIGRGFVALQALIAGNGVAMGSMVAATGRVMTAVRGMVALIAVIGTSIYAASQLFDDFGDVAVNALARIIEGIGSLIGLLAGGALGAAVGSAFGPVGTILGGIAGAFAGDKLADMMGVNSLVEKAKKAREEAEKTAAYVAKVGGGRGVVNPALITGGDEGGKPVDTKARDNAINALKKMTDEYAKQQVYLQKAIGLESEMLGMSDDQKTRLLAQEDLAKAYLALQDQLLDRKKTLTSEEQYLLPIIDAQLAKAKQLYAEQTQGLDRVLNKQQVALASEKDRLNVIEEINKHIERQSVLADQLRGANDKLKDTQFEMSTMAMAPMAKKIADINETARKGALDAGRAFSEAFGGAEDGLSPEKAKELADGLDQIAQKYKNIADTQIKGLDASRTFEAGWKTAFDSYMDSATNAATRAGDLFTSVTSSMNSAIDNFVDNGKFSFGDFASSLIKDMIKIELKASAMNLMKMMGGSGGGGFLSSIGSMLGFADGGNPPIGKASVVGENGPEVIVPRTASTVIPNGAGAGGQPVINNYYTVNAVDAKSVAQLFAENRKTLLGSVKMAEKELPYKLR
jgi:hypothetical protein